MGSPLQITVSVVDRTSRESEAARVILEAAKATPMSNTPRRPGESLTDWGNRLKQGDHRKAAAKSAPAKTRTGGSADFESKHPRGRGGSWTLKQGATGHDVRHVQRVVGAKQDGQYGTATKAKVLAFQAAHGLQQDGIVGRQTVAAMRGDVNAATIKPGQASKADAKWLRGRVGRHSRVQESVVVDPLAIRVEVGRPAGALELRLGEDLRLVEAEDLRLHEESDLAIVETVGGQLVAMDLRLVEATAQTEQVKFNADGTVDMVLIRPCSGRGVGNRIYEAEMLSQNAHVFSGWPMYDNHESEAAKRARQGIPRPPSELAGEIRESWWDASFTSAIDEQLEYGPGAVIARCMLTEDMEKLVRRIPRAVKCSLNAAATSMRPGSRNGRRGMIVEGILNDPENSSVDLVTKAGAGGQVASVLRQIAA